jgi:hypothetical protein
VTGARFQARIRTAEKQGARLIDEPLEAELQEEPADELTQDDGKR